MTFVCRKCQRDVDTPGSFCPFCGAPAPPSEPSEDPLIGSTIAGKYFVSQFLGRGGMGQVYKGSDLVLERPIAIKVLNKALLSDASMVQRFHREARAASRLNHPNCITILDFGQAEDERLYIVMEFLAGRSLARLLAEEYPLAQGRAVRIVSQVLAALGEAHASNIIHRDLKLANVMVETRRDEPDFVKVLDFGIAKLNEAGDGGLTGTGVVCGTPGYMSPEQARGETIDGRSDLYAVGVLLYELLTGVLPFEAATPMGQVTKHLTETPVAPSVRRPDLGISADLDALVMRALSKDPADRWVDAGAMRDALLECNVPRDWALPHTPRPEPRATMVLQAVRDGAEAGAPTAPPAVPGLRQFERAAPATRPGRPPGTPPPAARGTLPLGAGAAEPNARATPAAGLGRGTPMPRPPTPAPPARPTPPPAAAFEEAGADEERDQAAPARPDTPRPASPRGDGRSRPVAPARRASATWKYVAAGGAALVLVAGLAWMFSSDPYSSRPAQPPPDAGLTLERPLRPAQTDPAATTTPTTAVAPTTTPTTPTTAATPTTTTTGPPRTDPAGTGSPTTQPTVSPDRPSTPQVAGSTRPVRPPPPIQAQPPAKARKGSGVVEAVEGLNLLAVPQPGSGQGILAVTASPWGVVSVDGKELGETPREMRAGEGTYRVRVAHPTLGIRENTVVVPAGRRATFHTSFSK